MPRARPGPEQHARAAIDALEEAGWVIQDREEPVLSAATASQSASSRFADGYG
jgi:hypothetical protein